MRAFAVSAGGSLDLREVHVKGFAVKGGNGARGGGGGMGAGGAIFVHGGSLLVQWSTFEGNTATGGNGSTGSQFDGAGGGGGGLGGNGGRGDDEGSVNAGGGGGGSRGNGADAGSDFGAGGGGTLGDGGPGRDGGYRCGGEGGDGNSLVPFTGEDGHDGCAGGGGGGGAARDPSPGGSLLTQSGTGGTGGYGGGGGGGGWDTGDGGQGGFGGGGGAGAAFAEPFPGGGGGDGGFGGGGGSGPGGDVFGEPGDGGTFAGNATDFGGGGGAGLGGAIFGHQADITISNSTFTRNAAVRGVGGGEGAQNGADAGGAIFTVAGSLTVVNSTVAGNESTGDGAGITVYNPTTGEATSLVLRNTIVAANSGRDECFVLGGVSMSGWNNLVTPHPLDDTRTSCPGITQTGDPLLAPLTLAWPGRTPTMALNAASPAIDAGNPDLAPPDDQRGTARPQFAGFDIGAYEFGGPSDTVPPVADPTAAPAPNTNGWTNSPVTVTWNWADEAGGSGIDPANCTTSSSTIGEGLGIVLNAGCADIAGELGSASATVNVDLTAPTVTCSATPALVVGSSAGSVSATVTDTLSGPVDGTVTKPDRGGRAGLSRGQVGRRLRGRPSRQHDDGRLYVRRAIRLRRVPRTDPADQLPAGVDDPREVPTRDRLGCPALRSGRGRVARSGVPGPGHARRRQQGLRPLRRGGQQVPDRREDDQVVHPRRAHHRSGHHRRRRFGRQHRSDEGHRAVTGRRSVGLPGVGMWWARSA